MSRHSFLEIRRVLQLGFATLFPVVIALCAVPGTMFVGERYSFGVVPLALLGWCAVLLGAAVGLNEALFRRRQPLFPFLAATLGILSIWWWQRQAFRALVPSGGLTYGYFLKADGAHARFWILTCPFYVGIAWLAVCCIAAIISGWRAGGRGSLACMIPWWLAAVLVFSLPSMYLDGQGNASIFI
jgi:hypothetical protein